MTPLPTGRVFATGNGRDLVLTRTFRAPIEDVWASLTESERTARWFGPWEGEPGVGNTIRYRMVFESADAPWAEMRIIACHAPRHLGLYAEDDYGVWHLEMHLTESHGITELRFTQHLDAKADVGSLGAGWEFYLDNLVASRESAPMPDFSDYYPSMKQFFLDQVSEPAPQEGPAGESGGG